jgi:hypothetical protein
MVDEEWSGERLFVPPNLLEDYIRGAINPHTMQSDPIVFKSQIPEWSQAQHFGDDGWCGNHGVLAKTMPVVRCGMG